MTDDSIFGGDDDFGGFGDIFGGPSTFPVSLDAYSYTQNSREMATEKPLGKWQGEMGACDFMRCVFTEKSALA